MEAALDGIGLFNSALRCALWLRVEGRLFSCLPHGIGLSEISIQHV